MIKIHPGGKPTGLSFNKYCKRKYLQSSSFQGAYQVAKSAIQGFYQAIKKYKINPEVFKNKPEFPKANKKVQNIIFKENAIRYTDGQLILSTGFRNNPIKIPFTAELGMPVFATISLKHGEWWLSVLFKEEFIDKIKGNKILAIDLGIKRIATTFDGNKVETISGKIPMSLVQLENKKYAQLNNIKSKNKSRKIKKKIKGIYKQINRIKNRKKDVLHKISRYVIDKAIETGVKEIVAGDCSGIHDSPNLGRKNNQKISQGQEQIFWDMVKYKFERIGGKCSQIDESYSTQTCPVCGVRHKPKNRIYSCKCGFIYDRDGVGAINIYSRKVSFKLERSGLLTRPSGVKFRPQLSYESSEERSSGIKHLPKESVVSEPTNFS